MKKIWNVVAILVIFVLMVEFSSCEKEGVYNPKEKISKLIYEDSWVSSYYSDISEYEQIWTWDGNKLQRIQTDYEEYTFTADFKYDGKQLKEISGDHSKYVFSYDGSKLKKITLTQDNIVYMVIDIKGRDGKKINKLKFEISNMYWEMIKSGDKGAKVMLDMMHFAVSENLSKKIHKDAKLKNPKKSTADAYCVDVELKYSGDNIIEERWVYAEKNPEVIKYQYDDKNNPFFHALCYLSESAVYGLSENNVTSRIEYDEVRRQNIWEDLYVYTYSGNWPETKTCRWWEEYDDEGNLTYYEHERVTFFYK